MQPNQNLGVYIYRTTNIANALENREASQKIAMHQCVFWHSLERASQVRSLHQGVAIIEDNNILDLLWAKDESALEAVRQKYGRSLHKVAYNILSNNHDAEECVNDTLHRAWDAIPPKRPAFLGAYLSKITRNLSLKRWRAANTVKRGSGQADYMLSELQEAIPQPSTTEGEFEYSQTVSAINTYLRGIDTAARVIFIRRYFYGDSITDISRQLKASESKVKSTLFRARQKLKIYLEREGVVI